MTQASTCLKRKNFKYKINISCLINTNKAMYRNPKIPRLSKITEDSFKNRPKMPDGLKQLLEPKKELESVEVSSFSGSDISDAFEDLHKESFLSQKNKGKKSLCKNEADRLTMSLFTDDFKKAMTDTREELQLGTNIMLEDPKDIHKILYEKREPQELPQEIQDRINALLKDCEYICSTPSQASDDAPQQSPRPNKKESVTGSDGMSGVWRMLALHDAKEKFHVTAPSFNAFQQGEPHWLDRPPVPWETLDFSKNKCEKWLNEHH